MIKYKKLKCFPRELLWDYSSPPEDILWQLQRIADFFPTFGRDKNSVELLMEYIDQLDITEERKLLIHTYHEKYNKK